MNHWALPSKYIIAILKALIEAITCIIACLKLQYRGQLGSESPSLSPTRAFFAWRLGFSMSGSSSAVLFWILTFWFRRLSRSCSILDEGFPSGVFLKIWVVLGFWPGNLVESWEWSWAANWVGICVESRLGFGAALTKSPRPRCLFALGGIAVLVTTKFWSTPSDPWSW